MAIVDHDYEAAMHAQIRAADPAGTPVVSANAGSGKTHVLVNRVSRILLNEVEPEKILCLTYTKAAASEMQSRLFKTLGDWSIFPEEKLRQKLDELFGERRAVKLDKARRLFAEALETPEGLKVQTIHAFCERILSRFPIEAGITPGFEPIDESEMRALRETVRVGILKEAAKDPASGLNQALQLLTQEKADQTLDGYFTWVAGAVSKIEYWQASGGVAGLEALLALTAADTEASIKTEAWHDAPHQDLGNAAKALIASDSDRETRPGRLILAACAEEDPVSAFDLYAQAVLKNDGTIYKSLGTKSAGEAARMIVGQYNKDDSGEMQRMARVAQRLKALKVLDQTRALFVLACRYTQAYTNEKRRRRVLDFGDQINLARKLLCNSAVSEWVRYKLDGGIEHILLDEAQDTAPEQWEIINALEEAFEHDEPTQHKRTFFAVGDEKQSIYSFQGADPAQFLEKIAAVQKLDRDARVRMLMSFRSAPEILKFVDQLFVERLALDRMFEEPDYLEDLDLVRHKAKRQDSGQVEFWPLAPMPEKEEDNAAWDTRPVDATSLTNSRERLAMEVAGIIQDRFLNKEPVYDRDLNRVRPVRPGDILILVQSRNPFFDAVIRHLKARGIPVAGADRLKLSEAVFVKDMLSLARFVLLPGDDLSLAEILRSPLFDLSEEALFQIAHYRSEDETLWAAVQREREDIAAVLKDIIRAARQFAPFEFFSYILDQSGPNGESGYRRVYLRLGLEARDAVEAFLARALAHQRRSAPSLQKFLRDFAESEQELKREMSEPRDEVRVMTVHGAKGLEAPIVFLPDTTRVSKKTDMILPVAGGYVMNPSNKDRPPELDAIAEAAKTRRAQESLRLLYVALTRAESRLVICGFAQGVRKEGEKAGYDDGSWYDDLKQTMDGLETRAIDTPFGEGRVFGDDLQERLEIPVKTEPAFAPLPDWSQIAVPGREPGISHISPSHLGELDRFEPVAVRSPLETAQGDRFRRGNIIHKLLEVLPETEHERRENMADHIMKGFGESDSQEMSSIKSEVFEVLEHPDFAPVFAPGSRAEVSLAGRVPELPSDIVLNGQIDRISVTEDRVFIVDYKSNRPPPISPDEVPQIYWVQMAAYKALAQQIYPGKRVECALLWTDGPFMMVLDPARLDTALTSLPALPT